MDASRSHVKNKSSIYIHAKRWSPLGNSAGGQEQKELLLLWGLLWVELPPSKRYAEILTPSTYEWDLILK